MPDRIIGPACVAFSAVFYGAFAVLAKSLYAQGFDSITLLTMRTVPAAVLLWVYLIVRRKAKIVGPRAFLTFAAAGLFGLGFSSWAYYQSILYIPATTAVVLLYTYPSLVAVLGLLFFRERIGRARLLALPLTFMGAALLVGAYNLNAMSLNLTGLAYSLCAILAECGFVLLSYRAASQYPEELGSAYMATFTAAMFLVMKNPLELLQIPVLSALSIALLAVGAVASFLAILFFYIGVRRLGPTQSALLCMTEPLAAATLAFLFLGERLAPVQLLGAGMILAGMGLAQFRQASPVYQLDTGQATT